LCRLSKVGPRLLKKAARPAESTAPTATMLSASAGALSVQALPCVVGSTTVPSLPMALTSRIWRRASWAAAREVRVVRPFMAAQL